MLVVSVVIATYNSSKTIERALRSVFSQKGVNDKFQLQVIVVDDCSKDNTVEIIRMYPVQLFENQINSGGPNKGRNYALQRAIGDYITFIDHDDEWLPDKIVTQLEAIKDEKVITSGYIDVELGSGKRREIISKSKNRFIRYNENASFSSRLSRDKNSQITYFGSIMIHKDLKNIPFEEIFGMVDYDWVLRIFENQKSVEIAAPLFIRYVHNSNLSLNEKYRLNDLAISSEAINVYSKKYPKESKLGLRRLSSSMGRYYYLIGDVKKARYYFLKGKMSFISILYFITSYVGRRFVVENFKVFG